MSEIEERLNTILNNPQLMQQIASIAQTMGTEPQQDPPDTQEHFSDGIPAFDPKLIQTMVQTVGQTRVDGNQKALLHALSPYLSPQRIQKLERAMQAAKLAGAASIFLNTGGLQMLTGR